MKEQILLEIIKNRLDNSSYIGDDCAYLEELNIFITQDTLVEDVHFSRHTISPYLLGRKSVSVNLSDIAAALAVPKYITVSLSVPKLIKENFADELYRGINDICKEYNVNVIGGDITGGEKIVISVCAIGKKVSEYITSRSFAQKGDYILVTGNFGASAAGFHSLSNFLYAEECLINAHLNPAPRIKEASIISKLINKNIAAMDCSDGLVDALYKISLSSKHSVNIDINKVPVLQELKNYTKRNNIDYKKLVKWGGEDYELMLCVDEKTYKNLNSELFTPIGRVLNKDNNPSIIITDENKKEYITKEIFEKNSYNHF